MPVVVAFGLGTQEIIIIAVIVIVLFGATKLPQLGSAVGQGIRNFKRGMREVRAEEEEAKRLEAAKSIEDKSTEANPAETKVTNDSSNA